jgi:hypothetical protein
MEKVIPHKINWSDSLKIRLEQANFTPTIIAELETACTLGRSEIYHIDKLTIITRVEMLSEHQHEVVWMASLGQGVAKHIDIFLAGAARAGASYIRFHIAEDERAILRFWRKYHPVEIDGCKGAYRVPLEGVL